MPIISPSDLLLPAEPGLRALARELYALVAEQPIISPHGHVDPGLLAEDQPFPDPARLLVVPDHYLTRMLLSQGVPPADLGVPSVDGSPVETDGRTVWRRFAAHWHLFRGTPSRLWLEQTFRNVFDVDTPLSPATADTVYDAIAARLAEPGFRPRALFERFGIEVLATTESPLDDLGRHAKLAADGWGGPGGRVVTTFRPDDVVDMEFGNWSANVDRLAEVSGEDTGTYAGYLAALRARREAFAAAGATSSDHGHPTARTLDLSPAQAAALYDRGRRGLADAADAEAFRAHMLLEFARMSLDDGLVMQLHPGAVRNHNRWLHARHGRDVGGDVPQATEYVHALAPLLDAHGNDPRLTVVLYTLDEDTFTRELAPLAGGYAALRLGAPWWFLDSPEVLRRFREAVTETAGFYNTAGFVDDTRAFCSIPVRHDVARRVDAGFLARLVAEHRMTGDEAAETIVDLAYRLPKQVFKFGGGPS
ncbi:glucuronate isomerase [Micromonospora chalcea]|uniref:glucuronate isomerase n=1 Tax=Micromonospora sp. B006 TaxID=2201999 RepID=UPI000E3053B8|nr:glucuronate isomerase [Micromonospora sp. B006]AXO34883.1 uronate isomerase [Micromonospora sp. B006]